MKLLILPAAVLSAVLASQAVENPSFDIGQSSPQGWVLEGGQGFWDAGRTGGRSVCVVGTGSDSSYWRSTGFVPKAGGLYRLSFWMKGEGSGGCAIAGLNTANRDFGISKEWTKHTFIFRAPEEQQVAFLRVGQWHVNGRVWFDDLTISQLVPIHRRANGFVLGAGERVVGDTYAFEAQLWSEVGNYSRPLAKHTAGFNTDRWTFGGGQYVVYRHEIGSVRQTSGRVSLSVRHHVSGACEVEASSDGASWHPVGRITGVQTGEFQVPEQIFPARTVWIRLRAGDGAQFQVHGYGYTAKLEKVLPDADGATRFAEVHQASPGVKVELVDLGMLRPGYGNTVRLAVLGHSKPLVAKISVVEPGAKRARVFSAGVPAGPRRVSVSVPYELEKSGEGQIRISVASGRTELWTASVNYTVPHLYAADYGYSVSASKEADVWWCEATYKVSRERPAPKVPKREVVLEAAKGEYEPVQVVLRPRRALRGVSAAVTDFRSASGGVIPSSNVSIRLVDYVKVTVPTDSLGAEGFWPDPLPPAPSRFDVPANTNQPLWVTVKVPRDAKAGLYRANLSIKSGSWQVDVPLRLRVWDFALPESPRITSAFGFSEGLLRSYHNLDTREEEARVFDLYMQDFAEHRISPYFPMALAPIRVQVENGDVTLDFTEFDKAAHRYLDELGFTTFMLPIQGMGGGTFYERYPGSFGGYQQGTPEYERLMGKYLKALQDHLEEKGWLSKAYVYWFDEPDPKDYEFVREGMELIHRHAPKLARMLTEQPEPELSGAVDIWCPILDAYVPEKCQAEQRQGRKVWWYVCTGPKGRYTTLFIDHPAVNMRMWVWLSYKYGVDGLLVWSTNYWTSPTAFPPPAKQDPWADPMSYVSGYGTPAGTKAYWGNGDGRFLYPPKGHTDGRKRIEGPVDSFRWEMLREGIEDADTFFILRDMVLEAKRLGVNPALVSQAERLVSIPPTVASGLTEFTRDPLPMYKHRRAIALMIERLKKAISGKQR